MPWAPPQGTPLSQCNNVYNMVPNSSKLVLVTGRVLILSLSMGELNDMLLKTRMEKKGNLLHSNK